MTTGEQGLPRAPLLSSVSLVVGNLLPLWERSRAAPDPASVTG